MKNFARLSLRRLWPLLLVGCLTPGCDCWGKKIPKQQTGKPDFSKVGPEILNTGEPFRAGFPQVVRPTADAYTPDDIHKNVQIASAYAAAMQQLNCHVWMSVDFSNSNLTDADLAKLEFPQEVEEMILSETPIGDEGVHSLLRLKNLRT